jgi:hypothetical protein
MGVLFLRPPRKGVAGITMDEHGEYGAHQKYVAFCKKRVEAFGALATKSQQDQGSLSPQDVRPVVEDLLARLPDEDLPALAGFLLVRGQTADADLPAEWNVLDNKEKQIDFIVEVIKKLMPSPEMNAPTAVLYVWTQGEIQQFVNAADSQKERWFSQAQGLKPCLLAANGQNLDSFLQDYLEIELGAFADNLKVSRAEHERLIRSAQGLADKLKRAESERENMAGHLAKLGDDLERSQQQRANAQEGFDGDGANKSGPAGGDVSVEVFSGLNNQLKNLQRDSLKLIVERSQLPGGMNNVPMDLLNKTNKLNTLVSAVQVKAKHPEFDAEGSGRTFPKLLDIFRKFHISRKSSLSLMAFAPRLRDEQELQTSVFNATTNKEMDAAFKNFINKSVLDTKKHQVKEALANYGFVITAIIFEAGHNTAKAKNLLDGLQMFVEDMKAHSENMSAQELLAFFTQCVVRLGYGAEVPLGPLVRKEPQLQNYIVVQRSRRQEELLRQAVNSCSSASSSKANTNFSNKRKRADQDSYSGRGQTRYDYNNKKPKNGKSVSNRGSGSMTRRVPFSNPRDDGHSPNKSRQRTDYIWKNLKVAMRDKSFCMHHQTAEACGRKECKFSHKCMECNSSSHTLWSGCPQTRDPMLKQEH